MRNESDIFENIVVSSFDRFIKEKKFQYDKEESGPFKGVLKNKFCQVNILSQRYFEYFHISIINRKSRKSIGAFSLLEITSGNDSLIVNKLYNFEKLDLQNYYFKERYFKNNPVSNIAEFKKSLSFIANIIQVELNKILTENFDFHDKQIQHFRSRPSINYDKIFTDKVDHKFQEKVSSEINKFIKINSLEKKFSKFEINDEDKIWLNKLIDHKRPRSEGLSREYICAFEEIFEVKLPREYKLYLNYIGNEGRLIKLENSILSDSYFYGFHEQIDLGKPFDINNLLTGALCIYNYGCSVMFYLIITGKETGNILRTNCDVLPGRDLLLNNEGKTIPFRDWIQTI